MHGVEFYGQLSFLKAGLYYSDRLTTVSPTYAREIQTMSQGGGLDALLRVRSHDLTGILNGVDYAVWNPSSDTALPARYTVSRLAGKRVCKTALQQRLGLAEKSDALLFGVVSRLTEQKGLDLLLAALPEIVRRGGPACGTRTPATRRSKRACCGPLKPIPIRWPSNAGSTKRSRMRSSPGSDVIAVPSSFRAVRTDAALRARLRRAAAGTSRGRTRGYRLRRIAGKSRRRPRHRLRIRAFRTGCARRRDPPGRSRCMRAATEWKATQQRAMRKDFGWSASADRYLALLPRTGLTRPPRQRCPPAAPRGR